jgi:carbon storage regulator
MLALSRKINERIIVTIPPSSEQRVLTITLLNTRAGRARMGMDADKDVSIHREEVYEAIQDRIKWEQP